jgi:hypothetical protein
MSSNKKIVEKILLTGILIFGFMGFSSFFIYFNLLPKIINNGKNAYIANLCLAFAAFKYTCGIKQRYILLYLFAIVIIIMFLNGLNVPPGLYDFFRSDLQAFLRLFLMMILGYKWVAFGVLKKGMILIMQVGLVLSIISLFTTNTFLREALEGKTLTYSLQYSLLPSFFFLFLLDRLSTKEKFTVIACFSLYALEQVLFQKRLPLVRVAVTLAFFFYGVWLFRGYLRVYYNVNIIKRFKTFAVSFGIIAIGISILGFNLGIYGRALLGRFNEEGSASETLAEDPRWKIADIFYEELISANDLLIGRGLGGVVYHQSFPTNLDTDLPLRAAAEVGTATMLLKGGLLLVFYFLAVFLTILFKYRVCKKNIYSFAFWTYSVIFFIFLHPEGFLSNINLPYEMLYAYAFGACLAHPKLIRKKSYVMAM